MGKPYFTTIVAFSTPSGRLHIGHALGQVAGDVASRYAEMQGKKSFFPFGIHATGKDLLKILEEVSPSNSQYQEKRRIYGLGDEDARSILSNPDQENQVRALIRHYRTSYGLNLSDLGVNIEPDAFFSTDESPFHTYTQWVLRRLNDQELIVKTSSPRTYCPKCGDIKAIEGDFSEVSPEGKINLEDVRIQKGNMLFFYGGNTIYPVYTTRPETVFGATNLFFNPKIKYLQANMGDVNVVSEEDCLEDLVASLFRDQRPNNVAEAEGLGGRMVCSPFIKTVLPLVPGSFVKSDIGTGLVMSVPAHDPFDYFFLANHNPALLKGARAVILDTEGKPISFEGDTLTKDDLERVRETTYAAQEEGVMSPDLRGYARKRVPEARDALMKYVKEKDLGGELFRLTGGKFNCRVHRDQKITISLREENSIDYGNREVQERTVAQLQEMRLSPLKYKQDIAGIIRSRHAKPCERKADGNIGTPSPFADCRRVEALSDSNVYMEYYGIAWALKRRVVVPENLGDVLFDYLFLGRGTQEEVARKSNMSLESLFELKGVIADRYPIDINIAAKEHHDVHFPFSLFTHTAILPPELFPREYLLTSHVTLEGEKMSKSKGNVLYIDDLVRFVKEHPLRGVSAQSSLDAIRYFLMSYQSMDKDLDWSEEEFARSGMNRVGKYIDFVTNNIFHSSGQALDRPETTESRWFSTKVQRAVSDVRGFMETRKFREATISIEELSRNIQAYRSFHGVQQEMVNGAIQLQLRLMYPFTPRISEELGNSLFGRFDRRVAVPSEDLEFPEEHDEVEHRLLGQVYKKSLAGFLKRGLGVVAGRKLDRRGVKVIFPSQYSLAIFEEDPSLAKLLQGEVAEVNRKARVPSVEHDGVLI
jgi:leucyl-tRNA synthetase